MALSKKDIKALETCVWWVVQGCWLAARVSEMSLQRGKASRRTVSMYIMVLHCELSFPFELRLAGFAMKCPAGAYLSDSCP